MPSILYAEDDRDCRELFALVLRQHELGRALTKEEVQGLMANLLIASQPPLGQTHLADWLEQNRDTVGRRYASELRRHYE